MENFTRPEQVVAHLGAVQAQDYLGALWSVGLRLERASEAEVEKALAERRIVRSWPMRGTLHFVAQEDLRWLLALLGRQVVARATRRHRELGLDEATFTKSRRLTEKALEGGKALAREEVYRALEAGGVSTAGQRGIHIIQRLALDAVLCFGARHGKQQTFVLLDEWLPPSRVLGREEALLELARRYFIGHGPATVADLTWWSGLGAADARRAVELARGEVEETTVEGLTCWSGPVVAPRGGPAEVHLPPGFDELLLGYRDRTALLDPAHRGKVNPGANGMLSPTVVEGGRVVGTWKRTLSKGGVAVVVRPFEVLGQRARREIAAAAERYATFLGRTLESLGLP